MSEFDSEQFYMRLDDRLSQFEDKIGDRLATLEQDHAVRRSGQEWRRWAIPILLTLILTAGNVVSLIRLF